MDLDDTQKILERARQRETEMSFTRLSSESPEAGDVDDMEDEHNKNEVGCADITEHELNSEKIDDEICTQEISDSEQKENIRTTSSKGNSNDSVSARRARLAALSADVDNFEYQSTQCCGSYRFKNHSARVSKGETRASALFAPQPPLSSNTSSPSLTKRKLESIPAGAHAVEITHDSNKNASNKALSTVSEMMCVSEKNVRFASHIDQCLDEIADNNSNEATVNVFPEVTKRSTNPKRRSSRDYGIHNFFKRKQKDGVNSSDSEENSIATKCTSEGFGVEKHAIDSHKGDTLPYIDAEPDSFVTSTHTLRSPRADIIEEYVSNATEAIERPYHQLLTGRTKLIAASLEKKFDFANRLQYMSKPEEVVRKEEKQKVVRNAAKRNSPSEVITEPLASVKTLRNRWEVSSITGTPLHPDRKSEELLEDAVKMSKNASAARCWNERPASYHDSLPNHASDDAARQESIDLNTSAPIIDASFPVQQSAPEEISEIGNQLEFNVTDAAEKLESSLLIDDAFNFINQTPEKSSLVHAIPNSPGLAEISTAFSDDKPASSRDTLAYTLSFYRLKEKEVRETGKNLIIFRNPNSGESTSSLPFQGNVILDGDNFEKEKARIERAISVQHQQILQASRALSFSRTRKEFRGSCQEVDAEKALLIATEGLRSLNHSLGRLMEEKGNGVKRNDYDCCGTLTISSITVSLSRDFINGHINYVNDRVLFYFIVLIRHGETVRSTTMLTSDQGLRNGKLEFPNYIQLKSLSKDFMCSLEVFALQMNRLECDEERSYFKVGNTLKKKSPMPNLNNSSIGGLSTVLESSFKLIGHLSLNIESVKKDKFRLIDASYPVEGLVQISLQSYADFNTTKHRGFLSLFQPINNTASWPRFWCVLGNGYLNFWQYPEDESKKEPVVLMDLRCAASDGAKIIPMERCPYPNSMQIDIWIPSENRESHDKIRVLMAADKKDEMHAWLNHMNTSLRTLRLWNSRS